MSPFNTISFISSFLNVNRSKYDIEEHKTIKFETFNTTDMLYIFIMIGEML